MSCSDFGPCTTQSRETRVSFIHLWSRPISQSSACKPPMVGKTESDRLRRPSAACAEADTEVGPRYLDALVEFEAILKDRYCPILGMKRMYRISHCFPGFGRMGWRIPLVNTY